jgi:hypothetical protein
VHWQSDALTTRLDLIPYLYHGMFQGETAGKEVAVGTFGEERVKIKLRVDFAMTVSQSSAYT